jgi:biotin-dependent carboxylase-like uncharacterized protein
MDIIDVLDGGLLTSVQDLGRYGYQRYGVPVSGAVDQYALRAGNRLVGNDEGAAGLEMTLVGPRLQFRADTVVALTGADLSPHLDGHPVTAWEPFAVSLGSTLSFGDAKDGVRAYLAVAGGIDVPAVLGSRSTHVRSRLGGFAGRAMQAGDRLGVPGSDPPSPILGRRMPRELVPHYGHSHLLRVVLGPQDEAFTKAGIDTLLSCEYTVSSQSDRIGCRLEGPAIEHATSADIVSDAVPLGAVQVAGDGLPIILLADRGTTGGYTKIATVISVDMPALAQAATADAIRFAAVTVEEAHALLRGQEDRLRRLVGSPLVRFVRERFRATIDGIDCEVDSDLTEVPQPQPGAPPAGTRVQATVRVTGGGSARSFAVEIDKLDQ